MKWLWHKIVIFYLSLRAACARVCSRAGSAAGMIVFMDNGVIKPFMSDSQTHGPLKETRTYIRVVPNADHAQNASGFISVLKFLYDSLVTGACLCLCYLYY